MNAREFRQKFDNREPLIGFMQFLPSPQVTEIAGFAGYDWVWLCLEHGTTGYGQELENCIRAAEVSGMVPFVRITHRHAEWTYMRVLEAGAKGVVVPHVTTVDDAAFAVEQVRYPPKGKHGLFHLGRRWRYGLDTGDKPYGYIDRANEEVFVGILIEDKDAMKDVEAILSVEGIDFAGLGAFDMMCDLGCLQKGQKEYDAGLKIVAEMRAQLKEVCERKGVHFEEYATSAEQARELFAENIHFIHYGADSIMLMNNLKAMLKPVHEHIAARGETTKR